MAFKFLKRLFSFSKESCGRKITTEWTPASCQNFDIIRILNESFPHDLNLDDVMGFKNSCGICMGTTHKGKIYKHEVWVYDDVRMVRKLKNIEALCEPCYRIKHSLEHDDNDLKHMMKVNEWSEEQVKTHLQKSKTLWHYRNSFQWTSDYSWLKKFSLTLTDATNGSNLTRLPPLMVNYSISNESFKNAGMNNPKDFWPTYLRSHNHKYPSVVEIVLGLETRFSDKPEWAQACVNGFIEETMDLSGQYAQINIILPNPNNSSVSESEKCLGICRAHILISLNPFYDENVIAKPSSRIMEFVKSLCNEKYPNNPGEYSVDDIFFARWLTAEQAEVVWKRNLGEMDYIFAETRSDSPMIVEGITVEKPINKNPSELSLVADNFFLCRTEYPCWKCKKVTPVYAIFLQPGYQEWLEVDDDTDDWVRIMYPTHLTYITYVPEQIDNILFKISDGLFRNDYSKAFNGYYHMNYCAHCGMKQGDGQLCEPGSAFWPRSQEDLEKLSVQKIDKRLEAKSSCGWLMGEFFIDFENVRIKVEQGCF